MPNTSKSSSSSLVGRVMRKFSSTRKGQPHRFVFEPKRLLIDTDEQWRPVEHIVLVFRHRHRLFRSKVRSLEDSCSVGNRRVIVWPDRVMDDPIEFVTTLYNRRKHCNELDDKEWTLVVEGSMARTALNGGANLVTKPSSTTAPVPRPLATAELNVRSLICPADCVAEVRLEMRSLHEGVLSCSLDLVVRCFSTNKSIPKCPPDNANGQQQQEAHQVVGLGASNAGEGKARAVPDDGDRNSATVGGRTERANPSAEGARGAQEEQRAADSGSCAAPGSAAETEQINHHLRLIEEKEQLSRRQDFLVPDDGDRNSATVGGRTERANAGAEGARGAQEEQRAEGGSCAGDP